MELSDQRMAEVLEYMLPKYIQDMKAGRMPFMCNLLAREKDNPMFSPYELLLAVSNIQKKIHPCYTLFTYLDQKCEIEFDTDIGRIDYLEEQAVLFYKAWLEELKNGSSNSVGADAG